MKDKAGQKILQDLAAESDVLIENYIPGKLLSFVSHTYIFLMTSSLLQENWTRWVLDMNS